MLLQRNCRRWGTIGAKSKQPQAAEPKAKYETDIAAYRAKGKADMTKRERSRLKRSRERRIRREMTKMRRVRKRRKMKMRMMNGFFLIYKAHFFPDL